MSEEEQKRIAILDRAKLPQMYPTHLHEPVFWEQLGRTIATYGFLEEVLGKAIFAFTATRQYSNLEEATAAYEAWLPTLEHALKDTLVKLADSYLKATRENPKTTTTNVADLVEAIKSAASTRNVLCHGFWRTPEKNGASIPFFVNQKMEFWDTAIDVQYLQKVQAHVVDLACTVIDTVTHMGWQFPGGAGPGKPIWTKD